MKCQKDLKNAHLSFPEPSVASSEQQLKTQRLLIYYHNDTENKQILILKRLKQQCD